MFRSKRPFGSNKPIVLQSYAISNCLKVNTHISTILTSSVYSLRVSAQIKEPQRTSYAATLKPLKKTARDRFNEICNTPITTLYDQIQYAVSPTTKLCLNWFAYKTAQNGIITLNDLQFRVSDKLKESLRKLKMF